MRPVAKQFPITQRYGVLDSDYTAGYHTGTDFGCPVGTPVKAPAAGRVIEVYNSPRDYGRYVKIRGLGNKRAWLLAHLSVQSVHVGQIVRRGQVIGKSGNSGNVTGAHLHAEERHAPFGYRDNQKPTAWEG